MAFTFVSGFEKIDERETYLKPKPADSDSALLRVPPLT